jgi:hypothetical protein
MRLRERERERERDCQDVVAFPFLFSCLPEIVITSMTSDYSPGSYKLESFQDKKTKTFIPLLPHHESLSGGLDLYSCNCALLYWKKSMGINSLKM